MDNRLRKLEEEQKKLMEEIDRNNKRISGKAIRKKKRIFSCNSLLGFCFWEQVYSGFFRL